MSSLLGGNSKQSSNSSSGNQAYSFLQNALGGQVSNGTNANDMISQLLGGSPMSDGTSNAYNSYLGSTGYHQQLQSGSDAITGSGAAHGLLQSGSTAKALTQYGQNLGSSTFNNYLAGLQNLAGQGTSAAGVIAGAGQTNNTTSKGSSKQGLGI